MDRGRTISFVTLGTRDLPGAEQAVTRPTLVRTPIVLLCCPMSRASDARQRGACPRAWGGVSSIGVVAPTYSIKHFSQSNPAGPGQGDVATLLTRVAESIREMGAVEVQDLVFHSELDDQGEDWPSMSVYFHDANDLTSGSAQP